MNEKSANGNSLNGTAYSGPREKLLQGLRRLGRAFAAYPWVIALLVAFFLSLLIVPHFGLSFSNLAEGQFAKHAIKADRDFDIEDADSTERRRQESAMSVPPVYDYDSNAEARATKRISAAFEEMRAFFGGAENSANPADAENKMGKFALLSPAAISEQEQKFLNDLGLQLDQKYLDLLAKEHFSLKIEEAVQSLVNYALSRIVVSDHRALTDQVAELPGDKAITLRDLNTKKERIYKNLDRILDLATVQAQVEAQAKERIVHPVRRLVALEIARQIIHPTIDLNRAATEEKKAEVLEKVSPSIIHYRKNQLIVAEGQQITKEDMRVLHQMHQGAGMLEMLSTLAAATALLFLAQVALLRFGKTNVKKFKPNTRDLGFLAASMALIAMMTWLADAFSQPFIGAYSWITEETLWYIFPLAGVAMMVRFLMYSEAALVFICLAAPMAGLITKGSLGFVFYVLVGSLIAANRINQAQSRGKVIRAGLRVGAANVIVALAVQFINNPEAVLSIGTLVNTAAALVGGFITGPFVLAILPLMETVFGYTSNLQLMEMASLNHPLLGRMLMEAPGTYHHSLMVSALAEKGAEGISANPLLAKVAGLYHDVGKINKPHYFIENQAEGLNPHDDLLPRMSSLILIAHVREGVDYARRFRLGERIEQIIAQHHGKARINYFYDRAKQRENADREKIEEADFRYRGPKPQSKEAALVMLADIVEAATRSLQQPTSSRIETTVSRLINEVYADGQLDECEMTLKDLRSVAAQFTTILTGRFHGRISYPESEEPKKGKVISIPPLGKTGAEDASR